MCWFIELTLPLGSVAVWHQLQGLIQSIRKVSSKMNTYKELLKCNLLVQNIVNNKTRAWFIKNTKVSNTYFSVVIVTYARLL